MAGMKQSETKSRSDLGSTMMNVSIEVEINLLFSFQKCLQTTKVWRTDRWRSLNRLSALSSPSPIPFFFFFFWGGGGGGGLLVKRPILLPFLYQSAAYDLIYMYITVPITCMTSGIFVVTSSDYCLLPDHYQTIARRNVGLSMEQI